MPDYLTFLEKSHFSLHDGDNKKHRLTLKQRVHIKKSSLFVMVVSVVKFETGVRFLLPPHRVLQSRAEGSGEILP